MDFVVPAPPQPSLAVSGTEARFPVRRVYCVGRNYLAHIREYGHDEKAPPFFFAKTNDMVVENGSSIPYPPLTQNYHHEVELVVAIGTGGADTSSPEKALDHVYGYAIGFDMTRRDLQQAAAKSGRPWEIGKSFDDSAPCSEIYPAAKTGHFSGGEILITVNGAVRQKSDLNLMIWDVPHIISHLSRQVTLGPGDLIFTGTPDGVGPVEAGDTMVGRIEKLGDLTIKIS